MVWVHPIALVVVTICGVLKMHSSYTSKVTSIAKEEAGLCGDETVSWEQRAMLGVCCATRGCDGGCCASPSADERADLCRRAQLFVPNLADSLKQNSGERVP